MVQGVQELSNQSRHAVLLAVHRLPEQVLRLADRLSHPRVDLFLHVDRKFDASPFLSVPAAPVRRRFDIAWDGFGLVSAGLDWLRSHASSGRYASYTYLSGQDYPIRPVEEIVASLDSGDDLLIDMQWSADRERDSRWNRFQVVSPDPLVRIFDRLRRKFVPANRGIRPLPRGLRIGCGSALWTISGPAAAWLVDFLRERPDIERFFANTKHSDEYFFQTVLSASPFAERLGRHRHFIDWSDGRPHPSILAMEHFESIRASGMHFARKFDPVASRDLLDVIDRDLLGASPWKGARSA